MTKINPVDRLNVYAKQMINTTLLDAPAKKTYINNFLKTANDNHIEAPALIAYFTEYNKMQANMGNFSTNQKNRANNLLQHIENEINNVPELYNQATKFKDSLEKKYPKTLDLRVSLASEGAVISDGIEPKSKIKKILAFLNQFMKEEG